MSAKLARERATENLVNNLMPRVRFAEPLGNSVLCFLCKNILKNPMQLSCGHRVCKACNENSIPTINGERHCPEDKELLDRVFPDGSALRDIMNLSSYCLSDGCDWQGLLLDLEGHLKNCEFFIQLPCPYSDFQCNFMGSRSALDTHLQEESVKHDALLATSIRELVNSVDANSSVLNGTKEKTIEIEKAFIETDKELLALQQRLAETSVLIESQDENMNKLKEQQDVLKELLNLSENKKSKFVEFHDKFKELITKVENQVKFINESETGGGNNRDTGSNTKKTLIEKTKRLEDSNKTHDKQIADLGIKIRIHQCSSNNGQYMWKLDNLAKRVEEARSGKVTELYAPPLYTSTFGYKYSAKVMLGGESDKVGSNSADYVAFYIVIMQGDFDEILEFPFPYPITISLMNFKDKPHITHTLYPDPNKVHFQKPYKSMNPAIGYAKFISHEQLKTGFEKDNSIYFKITVEKAGVKVREPNI